MFKKKKQAAMEKPRKKHRLLKFIGFIFVILLILFFIGVFFGEDEYQEIETETDITKQVENLAQGGDSLSKGYEGEYGIWGVEQEQEDFRDYYVDTSKAENVTLMVYMVGADLESQGGAATSDLQEMIDSKNGENLNVVVQTGGASSWQNDSVSADARQRWLIQNQKLTLVDEIKQGSMCTKDSLSDFIKWSVKAYPADRYMLVFWDHGGGTMGGFGADENYPEDTLSLSDMAGAIAENKIKLDMVSYDACLMGTVEVGYAFEPYADYLLASEESEPGDGWYYTKALAALSKDPSMSTVEFGARMIDNFAEYYGNEDVTLSLMDLREIPALYEACSNYYEASLDLLKKNKDEFTNLSTARSKCRSYAQGECEQIDLVDYVQRTNVDNAKEIIDATFSAVKYRNDSSLTGSYGAAVYFPYSAPEYYQEVKKELDKIQYEATEGFYNEFLSILAGGDYGNESASQQLTGYVDTVQEQANAAIQQSDWYDASASEDYDYEVIQDENELNLNQEGDEYILSLSDEQWDSILDIQLQVMIDDGEGYIDLGSDQIFDWKDDNKLILDFDNYWTAINGNLAAYYACDIKKNGDNTTFLGKTPALLNGEKEIDIYIQTKQDKDENNQISIIGYVPSGSTGDTLPKGYLPLEQGDEIQLLCDYYTYDGEFDNSYCLGDPIIVDSMEALEVDEYDLEETGSICSFQLTDLYQQNWYTDVIEFSYDQ